MLTDAALRNLKPKSKIYKASDRDEMYVTVSPSGTVTFRYDYRFNGRRETPTLGRYGSDGISLWPWRASYSGRAENRPQGHITRARKATRETPGGRHQDLRHGDGDMVGQCKIGRQHPRHAQAHHRPGHPAGFPESPADRNPARRPAGLVQQGQGARSTCYGGADSGHREAGLRLCHRPR